MHKRGGNARRKQNADGRKRDDRHEVFFEFAPVNIERGFKDQRRQQDFEKQIFAKGNRNSERNKRQQNSGKNQTDRVWNFQTPRDDRHDRADQQNYLDCFDAESLFRRRGC